MSKSSFKETYFTVPDLPKAEEIHSREKLSDYEPYLRQLVDNPSPTPLRSKIYAVLGSFLGICTLLVAIRTRTENQPVSAYWLVISALFAVSSLWWYFTFLQSSKYYTNLQFAAEVIVGASSKETLRPSTAQALHEAVDLLRDADLGDDAYRLLDRIPTLIPQQEP